MTDIGLGALHPVFDFVEGYCVERRRSLHTGAWVGMVLLGFVEPTFNVHPMVVDVVDMVLCYVDPN